MDNNNLTPDESKAFQDFLEWEATGEPKIKFYTDVELKGWTEEAYIEHIKALEAHAAELQERIEGWEDDFQ